MAKAKKTAASKNKGIKKQPPSALTAQIAGHLAAALAGGLGMGGPGAPGGVFFAFPGIGANPLGMGALGIPGDVLLGKKQKEIWVNLSRRLQKPPGPNGEAEFKALAKGFNFEAPLRKEGTEILSAGQDLLIKAIGSACEKASSLAWLAILAKKGVLVSWQDGDLGPAPVFFALRRSFAPKCKPLLGLRAFQELERLGAQSVAELRSHAKATGARLKNQGLGDFADDEFAGAMGSLINALGASSAPDFGDFEKNIAPWLKKARALDEENRGKKIKEAMGAKALSVFAHQNNPLASQLRQAVWDWLRAQGDWAFEPASDALLWERLCSAEKIMLDPFALRAAKDLGKSGLDFAADLSGGIPVLHQINKTLGQAKMPQEAQNTLAELAGLALSAGADPQSVLGPVKEPEKACVTEELARRIKAAREAKEIKGALAQPRQGKKKPRTQSSSLTALAL